MKAVIALGKPTMVLRKAIMASEKATQHRIHF